MARRPARRCSRKNLSHEFAALHGCGARRHRFMKQKLFVVAIVTGLALSFVACNRSAPAPPSAPGPVSGAINLPATPVATQPELQKLKGKWERPDGGYILEIRSVNAAGKLDASY